MSRAKLPNGMQRKFLEEVVNSTNLDWSKIAALSNVCKRTLCDWRREKNIMSYETLLKLHRISNVPIPGNMQILPEYGSAQKYCRIGGLKRYELYGLGTPEGRRRGGVNSQIRFRNS